MPLRVTWGVVRIGDHNRDNATAGWRRHGRDTIARDNYPARTLDWNLYSLFARRHREGGHPSQAISTGLQPEMVVFVKPEFCAGLIVLLKQHARHVTLCVLVGLYAMVAAFMREERTGT